MDYTPKVPIWSAFADDFTIMSQAINIMQSTNFSEKLSNLFSQDGELDWFLLDFRTSFNISYLETLILSSLLFLVIQH